MIWIRCPKTSFASLSTVKIATNDAITCFNDGNTSRIRVLEELGLSPGYFCCQAMARVDKSRVMNDEKMPRANVGGRGIYRKVSCKIAMKRTMRLACTELNIVRRNFHCLFLLYDFLHAFVPFSKDQPGGLSSNFHGLFITTVVYCETRISFVRPNL